MAGGYRVGIDELGNLINLLDHAAQNMANATAALRTASADGLGSRAVDGAAREFQESWSYGIGKISEAAGKMTESLRAAKKDYEQTEDCVRQLFPSSDSPPPQGSAGAGSPEVKPAYSGISQVLDGALRAPAVGGQTSGGRA